MITKSVIKQVQSLRLKKFRQKYDLFVAEGAKTILTMLDHGSFELDRLYATTSWLADQSFRSAKTSITSQNVCPLTERDLKAMSHLKHAPEVIGVFRQQESPDIEGYDNILYLDDLQDPGNVGTIIRVADWYGVDKVIRSPGSADFFGSKTVMSTMGSLGHVPVGTIPQSDFASTFEGYQKIGLTMDKVGDGRSLAKKKCIIIGNEGHGISKELIQQLDIGYHIPGDQGRVAESLNAAMATAIAIHDIIGKSIH